MAIAVPKIKEERKRVFLQLAQSGDIAEVKRLIEERVDVNVQDNNGVTALMFASYAGHTEVAKLLIEAGADVNEKNKYGHTALICASTNGHTEIVKLLKEAGAK